MVIIAPHPHPLPPPLLSTAGAPTLPRIDDESVFTDPEASLTSDSIAIAASPLDQVDHTPMVN